MRCLACGDHVPFWGGRCPFCGEEKTPLQATRMLGLATMLAGAVSGGLHGGWVGGIAGGIAGGLIWAGIEGAWNRLVKTRKRQANDVHGQG